jgi:hypothetical protein
MDVATLMDCQVHLIWSWVTNGSILSYHQQAETNFDTSPLDWYHWTTNIRAHFPGSMMVHMYINFFWGNIYIQFKSVRETFGE